MKTRNGFVSNSSSSSFIVNLNDISKLQLLELIELSASHWAFSINDTQFIEFEEPRSFGWDTKDGVVMSNLKTYLNAGNIDYKKL